MKRVLSIALISVMLFPMPVNLRGGKYPRKDMSLWELHRYKYTDLLRKEPLCWCPFKSYLVVDDNVVVGMYNNYNCLCINADLIELTKADAQYNKTHAPKYKGKAKTRVRKIYNYCRATKYKIHVKTARSVFEKREGDCAGIAEAFYVMCKKNKIPVRYVIGWAGDGCHAWNRVKIGKKWYWVDATLGKWLSRRLFPDYSVLEIW